MSSAEIHSAISRPRPVLKRYHQLVHGLNSLLVWFQHLVWSADGAVCDVINTMSDRLQNGWIGGGYFHLLQAPFGAVVAKEHFQLLPFNLALQWVQLRCQIGCCFRGGSEDVSAMRQLHIMH